MYLTKLVLNPRNRQVQRDLANPHDLHRTIMRAFPSEKGPCELRKKYGVLYRLEINASAAAPTVLVQSNDEPNWSFLEHGYLFPIAGDAPLGQANPAVKHIDALYRQLEAGRILRFRLTANVTKKIDTKTGEDGVKRNGRRVPLRTPEEQLDWLRRKASTGGFELVEGSTVPDVRMQTEQDVVARRATDPDNALEPLPGTRMTFGSVTFDGRLRIKDSDLFRQTLATGIGSAKAYGYGLLSIAGG